MSKATECKKCNAPRDMALKDVLCRECWQHKSALRARQRRGTPLDAPFRSKRTHPGMCLHCDQPKLEKYPYCREHLNQKHRDSNQRRGMLSLEEYKAKRKAEARKCKVEGCASKISTKWGQYCEVCRIRKQSAKAKPATPPMARIEPPVRPAPVKPVASHQVVIEQSTPIVIGPQAFAAPAPIQPSIAVKKIPSTYAAEEEARRQDWEDYLNRYRSEL